MAKDNRVKKETEKVLTRGVGLRAGEWAEIEKLARELDSTPHAIAAYGVRYFLKSYGEGKIKPEIKKTQRLPDL